jgi:hypothetical protein
VSIIEIIGPRLTDPKRSSNEILNRFRFAEEKELVQSILKARAVTQNSNIYSTKKMDRGRLSPQRRMKQSADRSLSPPPSRPISRVTPTELPPAPTIHQPKPDPSSLDLKESISSLPAPSAKINVNDDSINREDSETADFSPATTNEDLENMIEDKEEMVQLQNLTLDLSMGTPQLPTTVVKEIINSVQLTQPSLVIPEHESQDPQVLITDFSRQDPPKPVRMDDDFCFDSPVIDVVGTKTRVLSVHTSQPVSKVGREVEFLTQTDEFSFDERFQVTEAGSNQSSCDLPSSKWTLPSSPHTPRHVCDRREASMPPKIVEEVHSPERLSILGK